LEYGAYYKAFTFTVGHTGSNTSHDITSLKMLVHKAGSPGIITFELKDVDSNNKPTGSVLTSGTTDGDTLTTNTDGEWREVMITPYTLSPGIMYSVVIYCTGADYVNSINIHGDGTSSYTAGNGMYSTDSGSTWTLYTMQFLFEEYGTGGSNFTVNTFDVIQTYLNDTGTQTFNMTGNNDMNYTANINYTLSNITKNKGYNYSAYNQVADTNLSNINTSIGLEAGEFLSVWNDTSYSWTIWLVDYYETDDVVSRWSVIATKVEDTEYFVT